MQLTSEGPSLRSLYGSKSSPPRNGLFTPTKVAMGRREQGRHRLLPLAYIFIGLSFVLNLYLLINTAHKDPEVAFTESKASQGDRVLVSYSYFEKDDIQKANAEFFWKVGMGINSMSPRDPQSDFVIIVNGETCGPCQDLYPLLSPDSLVDDFPLTLTQAWSSKDLALLWRSMNEGMDFAAHNVTLEWVKKSRGYSSYRYFLFLNSSVRGPFIPSYMPSKWQWQHAFTQRLQGDIVGVSSSLVCLPEVDAGGPGPKMESWAFALSQKGDEGIVVKGEYGLSTVLLSSGFNIATLLSRYAMGTDWRDPEHWGCNDQVHPSRHGTYDHISMHPFETVFVKASWHVGQPHVDHYSNWLWTHAQGRAGTDGAFDEKMYRYAISLEAQEPNFAEECFKVLHDEMR